MALIRWEPVTELNTLQNEMNRLFSSFFDQPAPAGRGGAPSRRWIPAMDLVETGDHYVLRADLPGLSDDDVSVQLEDNVLTVSGERKTQHEQHEEGYYRIERAFGNFARSLTLPDGIDPDAVHAHFDRGVLEIRTPNPNRKSPARSRSPSAPVQPTTPRRSRAPTPATRKSTAAIRSQYPPDPRTAIPTFRHRGPRAITAAVRDAPNSIEHVRPFWQSRASAGSYR